MTSLAGGSALLENRKLRYFLEALIITVATNTVPQSAFSVSMEYMLKQSLFIRLLRLYLTTPSQ